MPSQPPCVLVDSGGNTAVAKSQTFLSCRPRFTPPSIYILTMPHCWSQAVLRFEVAAPPLLSTSSGLIRRNAAIGVCNGETLLRLLECALAAASVAQPAPPAPALLLLTIARGFTPVHGPHTVSSVSPALPSPAAANPAMVAAGRNPMHDIQGKSWNRS